MASLSWKHYDRYYLMMFRIKNNNNELVRKLMTHDKLAWLDFEAQGRIEVSCGYLCDHYDINIKYFDKIVSALIESQEMIRTAQNYKKFMSHQRIVLYKINSVESIVINSTENLVRALEHYFAQQQKDHESGMDCAEDESYMDVSDGLVFYVKFVGLDMRPESASSESGGEPTEPPSLAAIKKDVAGGSDISDIDEDKPESPKFDYLYSKGKMATVKPNMENVQRKIDEYIIMNNPRLMSKSFWRKYFPIIWTKKAYIGALGFVGVLCMGMYGLNLKPKLLNLNIKFLKEKKSKN